MAVDDRKIIVDNDISSFEVCKDFLKFTFPQSKSMDMLCRPWAPEGDSREEPLPSWIAQRTNSPFGISINRVYRRINADPLVGRPDVHHKVYNASKLTPAQYKFGEGSDRTLSVQGFILDVVKEKRSNAAEGIIPSEWVDTVGWKDVATKLPPDTFWRTLVANRDTCGRRPPFLWKRVCQDSFNRRSRGSDLNTKELLGYDCPSAIREFLQRVQRVVWKRRLVLLERNELPHHLDLAPSQTKKGDIICVLFGCSVPVALRQYVNGQPASKAQRNSGIDRSKSLELAIEDAVKPSATVHYEFIGECYIHGFMDGEAVRKSYKAVSFSLR